MKEKPWNWWAVLLFGWGLSIIGFAIDLEPHIFEGRWRLDPADAINFAGLLLMIWAVLHIFEVKLRGGGGA